MMGELWMEDLDRDSAADVLVNGFEDRTHATCAELPEHAIWADILLHKLLLRRSNHYSCLLAQEGKQQSCHSAGE